jgi:hypothetical protein
MADFNDGLRQIAEAHHRELTEQAIAHAAEVGRLKARINELEACEMMRIAPVLDTPEMGAGDVDADGWIEWHGGECPVPHGTLVDVKHRDGSIYYGHHAGEYGGACDWSHERDQLPFDIIAYRLYKKEGQ